MIRNPR